MRDLLEKTRSINRIIQKAGGHPISFSELAEKLSESINANVYIIGKKGKLLGHAFTSNFYCPTMDEIVRDETHFPEEYNEYLLNITETKINMDRQAMCLLMPDRSCFRPHDFTAIIPVIGGGQRLGTLIFSKTTTFDDFDLVLAEYGATLIGTEILRAKIEKIEKVARQKAVVSIAFDTLSYSELEAVEHIFNELHENQGLLVASKIADKVGITRSVIVNALRKLESAGVVEVRSLGMKGTYIRILNDYLLEELERIQGTRQRI